MGTRVDSCGCGRTFPHGGMDNFNEQSLDKPAAFDNETSVVQVLTQSTTRNTKITAGDRNPTSEFFNARRLPWSRRLYTFSSVVSSSGGRVL